VRGSHTRAVREVQGVLGRVLHGDDEAHAVAAAARERRAGVLDADGVHQAAAFVRALLYDPALKGGHSVRVVAVDDGQRHPRVAVPEQGRGPAPSQLP
jgi:hypothetical protein